MPVQIIMDSSGDSRHEFDLGNPGSIAEAEQRFRSLTAKGYRAVAFAADEERGTVINDFDPEARKTVFIPRLVGG